VIPGVGLVSAGMDARIGITDPDRISSNAVNGPNGGRRSMTGQSMGSAYSTVFGTGSGAGVAAAVNTRYLLGHTRGIYSFAYHGTYRCLLSAGFDQDVSTTYYCFLTSR